MDREYDGSLVRRDFDAIRNADGNIVYVPKNPALRMLGKPPWELELTAFEEIIPDEAVDLVGSIVWRGVTFTRGGGREWVTGNQPMTKSP